MESCYWVHQQLTAELKYHLQCFGLLMQKKRIQDLTAVKSPMLLAFIFNH